MQVVGPGRILKMKRWDLSLTWRLVGDKLGRCLVVVPVMIERVTGGICFRLFICDWHLAHLEISKTPQKNVGIGSRFPTIEIGNQGIVRFFIYLILGSEIILANFNIGLFLQLGSSLQGGSNQFWRCDFAEIWRADSHILRRVLLWRLQRWRRSLVCRFPSCAPCN